VAMARCLASSRTGIRAVILLAMAAWQLPEGACFTPAVAPPSPAHCARVAGEGCRRSSSRPHRSFLPACYPRPAGVLARTQVVQPRSVPLRALSTPPAESSRSECSIRELGRLLDLNEAEIDVREAAGMEGDCVAQLRCSVFGQGKDMYRSQRHKMRTSPHYLLAGIYKTTLMVAVVRALTPRARQVCKEIVLADMQELLDQAWISPWEHAHLLERLEHEWQPRSELVVGSVDCSVHEMFDSSLTLRRWVYVSSMAVREDVRQRGVGEQLLNLGVAHARKIFGVKHMFLHVEVPLC
jgi:ribosomal protein S18 acetylase RimI-like enzyme